MKRAIYPGSFDPLTLGHLDMIERSAKIVDELVIGVLNNSAKNSLFSLDERVSMIKEMTESMPNVTVASFDGLLVDYMKEINATIIVRGLRAVTDFEYELQIAQTNHVENPEVETIYSKVEDEPLYQWINDRLVDYISIWQNTVYQATTNGYSTRAQENTWNTACEWVAAYTKMADSMKSNYIPHVTGYSIRHKYRAKKNTDNVVVYDEVFVLDSTLTKVVEVKKE